MKNIEIGVNCMKYDFRSRIAGMACLFLVLAAPGIGRNTLHGEGRCASALPSGFADIRTEIPDAVIDIRYATTDNFTGGVLDGYEASCAWGLEEMVRALVKVRNELRKQGYRIVIYDAYRPLRAERHMIRWALSRGKDSLLGLYIPSSANPDALYGHPSGNAVDLTMASPNGFPVNMGTSFDEFTTDSRTANASGEARMNRFLLREIMERNGFRNYSGEWWHYWYLRKRHRALDVPVR